MSDCCSPKGYRRIFSERNARAEATRYRRQGLDGTSRRVFEHLSKHGLAGKTILEIGGGIGTIQLELLKAGAASATCVELTPTYEEVAAELMREAGLAERIERRVMDFAEGASQIAPADIVIMNRVICCYPDMPKLTEAAAGRTRQLLVLSYPRRTWWTRIGLGLGNFVLRATKREFQIFLHPPVRILAISKQLGLAPILNQTKVFWTVTVLSRSTPQTAVG
jgi:2-polyprenyl-3-methyl-5-hydroxy-6-metoxy-1,4-benzoquinol methylase